jgi:hypothetical protein
MSLNRKKNETKSTSTGSPSQTDVKITDAVGAAREKLRSITNTAKGALSNSSLSPVRVPAVTSPSPKGTSLEKAVGAVVSTGAKLVGGMALAAALVCVASGIAQDYARKKRYKAGSGSFWTMLATIPSFKHPRPFYYKIALTVNGRYVGDENAGDVYKRFCLIPAVKQNSLVYLLDDWGGWLSLYLNKGDGPELVISHDKGNDTILVVNDDLDVVQYELPPQVEVAPLLYVTESV